MLRPAVTRLPQAHLIAGLAAIVGPTRVSTELPDLVAYSADFWPKLQIWKLGGDPERYPPDCVVWPSTEAEVQGVVSFCAEHAIPLIPYGGGSGVCGGTVPISGGVVVDLKRLRSIVAIDRDSHTVTAEGGILGQHLEDRLAAAGFTLGHFPSSIMCSTLGGWLATRSGGQFSSRYGKIEDMVLSLRVVLADGSVLDTADRSTGDPDWTQLLVGSEGTLGFITQATLRVHAAPASRHFRGFKFHTLYDGLTAMRLVMQAGLEPVVLRLYDPFDSMVALGKQDAPGDGAAEAHGMRGAIERLSHWATTRPGAAGGFTRRLRRAARTKAIAAALSVPSVVNKLAQAVPSQCLLIIGFEGPDEAVQRSAWRSRQILLDADGTDAGSHVGETWLAKRHAVSFKQARIYQTGSFVDTMEVATTWDRLPQLYESVRRAVSPHAFIMAHFSHAYREGCSIYFTFAAHRSNAERSAGLYDTIWDAALLATQAAGGTTSHHHGVGISKKHAMVAEHGEMLRAWRALKDAMDPQGILNPGKLFPDNAGGGA
ncbi:MAG: FAD-binding oxidoreductase [Deltaproteobacteria bacterium]|nr:FAD-binding oxidoreductase [Deltaproteobacteria bacterium]MCB9788740.1 FAD-binding oxidoreductase [Deltaproteobacteria bacterium]